MSRHRRSMSTDFLLRWIGIDHRCRPYSPVGESACTVDIDRDISTSDTNLSTVSTTPQCVKFSYVFPCLFCHCSFLVWFFLSPFLSILVGEAGRREPEYKDVRSPRPLEQKNNDDKKTKTRYHRNPEPSLGCKGHPSCARRQKGL